MCSDKKGVLYVVATPIGNLKDITIRALETLKSVNIIACEDTRVTKKLLNYYGIHGKKLIPYHEHIEEETSEKLISILKCEEDIALVSDAGTPCISDPGYRVVKKAWENGIRVVPVPGAFAGAAALSASGLPSDKFLFVGFLPNKPKKKEKLLEEYIKTGITFILYESPRRIKKTIQLIGEISPESDVVVAKEITKIHERFFRGKAKEILNILDEETLLKGEFVIVVYPADIEKKEDTQIHMEIQKLIREGKKAKEIAREISTRFGIPKNKVYKIVVSHQKE
ncbi:16S rRNA (cytidine(1402)-2'-O)-methyltransferase [Persephonella sp.]|uniref:16S rRNA (cytidine(1402)-2'-O)-methyltransferase n=1 Tax=Persephonella sp. TaxID=2060922 RepID=UPI0025DFCDB9|nr:16S rRNA (cytidine(1402)-2'-O)-methyltransferase [Persephonella sp.]